MSSNTELGKKRCHSELIGLRVCAERSILLVLNKAFEDLKYSIESDTDREEKGTQSRHECPLMEVTKDSELIALIVYMLTHECGEELCKSHGISMNGQVRGQSTLVVIDVII
mmetsp:Transcript_22368/g.21598  ORF Transcript_22368/g.21598 Transcript_22368/m.21598 type:complete len:112 (-) Transcript_22368:163-498(-)